MNPRLPGRALVVLSCWLAVLAPACGEDRAGGTDSNTHWMKPCQRDDECGELSCLCGVCSTACDRDSDCGQEDAICVTGGECSLPTPAALCVSAPEPGMGGCLLANGECPGGCNEVWGYPFDSEGECAGERELVACRRIGLPPPPPVVFCGAQISTGTLFQLPTAAPNSELGGDFRECADEQHDAVVGAQPCPQ